MRSTTRGELWPGQQVSPRRPATSLLVRVVLELSAAAQQLLPRGRYAASLRQISASERFSSSSSTRTPRRRARCARGTGGRRAPPERVSVTVAARRSCASRVRTTRPRATSVVTISVALAFDVRSRRRSARSSSSPPAVASTTSTQKPDALTAPRARGRRTAAGGRSPRRAGASPARGGPAGRRARASARQSTCTRRTFSARWRRWSAAGAARGARARRVSRSASSFSRAASGRSPRRGTVRRARSRAARRGSRRRATSSLVRRAA